MRGRDCKSGTADHWQRSRMEGWKNASAEELKNGRIEQWKSGRLERNERKEEYN